MELLINLVINNEIANVYDNVLARNIILQRLSAWNYRYCFAIPFKDSVP